MSEYQFYEFRAIDRPLDRATQDTLRGLSSRAEVTASGLSVVYNYGDFRGDVDKLMETTFDALVYVANWGTRRLSLRFPAGLVNPDPLGAFVLPPALEIRKAGAFVVIDLVSEREEGDWEEGEGWIASLLPLRAELLAGDRRPLYLAWLAGLRGDDVSLEDIEDVEEPLVPSGLQKLSAAQTALVEFLRIDEDLLAVAAKQSPALAGVREELPALRPALLALSPTEKNQWLERLLLDQEPHLGVALRQRLSGPVTEAAAGPRRKAGELLAAAERRVTEREKRATKQAAAEEARLAREAEASRQARLNALSQREEAAWAEVDAWIAERKPATYSLAVARLRDLVDLAVREGRGDGAITRLRGLREVHRRKLQLLAELDRAGLK